MVGVRLSMTEILLMYVRFMNLKHENKRMNQISIFMDIYTEVHRKPGITWEKAIANRRRKHLRGPRTTGERIHLLRAQIKRTLQKASASQTTARLSGLSGLVWDLDELTQTLTGVEGSWAMGCYMREAGTIPNTGMKCVTEQKHNQRDAMMWGVKFNHNKHR